MTSSIRGGTILDGTGSAAFAGDVAIDGAKVAQVGGKAGPAKCEIDANGLLVTPGWVDVHTHYDGQATWDPVLAPSSWHGVTTILFGNCGVGFAPGRQGHPGELGCLVDKVAVHAEGAAADRGHRLADAVKLGLLCEMAGNQVPCVGLVRMGHRSSDLAHRRLAQLRPG
jgi:N-acyl-D-aspartate/D-glutamate deacylase